MTGPSSKGGPNKMENFQRIHRATSRPHPCLLRRLLCWFSAGFTALALLGSIELLLLDAFPTLTNRVIHASVSAAALLLAGTAYLALQLVFRPSPQELVNRIVLGSAFVLWGIQELLPAGALSVLLGDVVITLFIVDLSLIIKADLHKKRSNTP